MRIKVTASCLFCSAIAFAAQPAWELAPPDAKILIGVDVRGLRNSSLSDSITPDMRKQMQAPMAMFHVPGIELLDDIDSVFLASTGDLSSMSKSSMTTTVSTASKPAAPKPNTPFVLVVSGNFPDEHLRPLLKGAHPSYKGINVYRGTGADPTSIAVLDEHTVLLGDDKSIYRAIDRRIAKLPAQGPLIGRGRELAEVNDIWIVARDSSGTLQKATGPGAIFASEIEGLDLGLAVHDGFNMGIGLDTKTEAGAQMLSNLISTQMQTAVSAKLDDQKAAEFWRKVKVSSEGKRMQLRVALTKEELAENIRIMQEQRSALPSAKSAASMRVNSGDVAVSGPGLVTTTHPAAPPQPRSVKIYGLDDGVRVINLDKQ